VGTIGGKTQTDLGGMDDLYIDGERDVGVSAIQWAHPLLLTALGIADDVAALGLKGTKKKKGRKLDEDFIVCSGRALAKLISIIDAV
jgi:histone-lysine N-methyltransferase SETD2